MSYRNLEASTTVHSQHEVAGGFSEAQALSGVASEFGIDTSTHTQYPDGTIEERLWALSARLDTEDREANFAASEQSGSEPSDSWTSEKIPDSHPLIGAKFLAAIRAAQTRCNGGNT